jgi:hypothetical protein
MLTRDTLLSAKREIDIFLLRADACLDGDMAPTDCAKVKRASIDLGDALAVLRGRDKAETFEPMLIGVHTAPSVDMPQAINLPLDMLLYETNDGISDDALATMRMNIEANGITVPLDVQKVSDEGEPSRYAIIDGRKRFLVARELKMQSVPCVIVADSEE